MRYLVILLFLSLSSCCPAMREVVITVPETPWEQVYGQRFEWSVKTSLPSTFILRGGREVIRVPYGKTVYLSASIPHMAPLGCVVEPGVRTARFSRAEGRLVSALLSLSESRPALEFLNYRMLLSRIEDVGRVDVATLLQDVLNGEFCQAEIIPDRELVVEGIPSGRWISSGGQSFFSDGSQSVLLMAENGLNCYLCIARSLVLRLFCDSRSGKFSWSLHPFTVQ